MSELWKFLSLWLPKIHISILKKGSTKECFKPSGQLHSFPMLVSSCLKSCMLASVLHKPRTYRCPSWIRKGSRTRDQTAPLRKERNSRKTSTCVSWNITSWEIDGETVETVSDVIFGGSKITADGDCSHEIKRRLLLGRKVVTNLDSILKRRDITLPTKVHLVKAMVFPVVMYGYES